MGRIVFWAVIFAPVFVTAGALIYTRRKRLAPGRLRRELFVFLLSLGALAAWVLYDALHVRTGTSAHVYLQRPVLLLAIVPAYALILWIQSYTLSGISRGRMWTAFMLRATIINLMLLAMAGLQMVIERDALRVLFVLDVSKSVPKSEQARALKAIQTLTEPKKADDEAGLVVFGAKAMQEVAPTKTFAAPEKPDKLKSVAEADATDIAQALRRSLATFDEDARKRLVLFTDGRQTLGDAAEEVKRLVSLGVDVWIVPLKRGDDPEMLVEKIELPNSLLWEQPFDCHVFVRSNIPAKARVRLYLGDRAGVDPQPQVVELTPGKNRLTFHGLKMRTGGAKQIHAVLEQLEQGTDTLPENNEAYAFTDVQTENRILILTSDMDEVKFLVNALEGEKMTLDVRSGPTLPDNPEVFRGYDCIVLANIARGYFSEQQLSVIESCVKDQGAGLVMTGGEQSFGAGGYLHTKIEDALPVQMDLQNERVMPSGALCIVLHTCEFGDGNAWGKKISKAAMNVLSPRDYAGLLYFDHAKSPGEQWCFKPTLVARKQWMFGLIDACSPGDMPALDPIVAMAVKSLQTLNNVSLKHCIVISDGDPSGPTAATLAAARNAKVTVSTISIFPHGGREIGMLKDVAAQTGGRYYSADDPKKLPHIFIKEAAVVRKSLIREDEQGIPVALGMPGPTLKEFGSSFQPVKGLVVTNIKQRAELQLYTTVAVDDGKGPGEKVPVLASWHYGLGKAVAFTSDCTNRWGTHWVNWGGYKRFWINTLTWVSRQRMPSNHTVTTRIEGDTGHVIVEGIDAEGAYLNFAKLVGTAVDPGVATNSLDAESYTLNFQMSGPGKYEATFPVKKAGAYAVTIIDQSDPRRPQSIITGVANSYSPEFLHLEGDEALLEQMAKLATPPDSASRRKELQALTDESALLWAHDQEPARKPSDLYWLLLLLALCLFPFDVAIRRLALDPERALEWLGAKLQPLLLKLGAGKRQLQQAAAEALSSAPPPPPPAEIVPSGEHSREAQSRYEQAGTSAEAQNIDFSSSPQTQGKPAVGGTKVSQPDQAASDYTRALLKAKKRAQKDKP